MTKNKKKFIIYFLFLLLAKPFLYSFIQTSEKRRLFFKLDGDNYLAKRDTNYHDSEKYNFIENKNLKKHDNLILDQSKEVIVFVHGTILPIPSPSGIFKTLKGDKAPLLKNKSFYDKLLNNMRYKGFFKYQPIDELGLVKIDMNHKSKIILKIHQKSTLKILSAFDYYYKKNNPDIDVSYYTFGWSGHLDQQRRAYWSEKLYLELINIVKNNKKDGFKTNIIIIAHSYGGNVTLKLADAENKYHEYLNIQDVFLLGTPVQPETSALIYSDVFHRIYNIYSRGDPVQIIDFISTKKAYSKRKFSGKDKAFPNKLIQIEVLCGKLKPMHNELWYVKSADNLLYRRRLTIAPYPIAVFVPEVLKVINEKYVKSLNLRLNFEKDNKKLKLCFSGLNSSDNDYEYSLDFPNR